MMTIDNVNELLSKYNLSMTCEDSGFDTPIWDSDNYHKIYTIWLKGNNHSAYTIFYDSLANTLECKDPDMGDAIYSILMNISTSAELETFDDFISIYGIENEPLCKYNEYIEQFNNIKEDYDKFMPIFSTNIDNIINELNELGY